MDEHTSPTDRQAQRTTRLAESHEKELNLLRKELKALKERCDDDRGLLDRLKKWASGTTRPGKAFGDTSRKRPTLRCCNTDTSLLLDAADFRNKPEAARYEIRPGEDVLRFVINAVDAAVKRRFKGKGLGKKARGELAAIIFDGCDEDGKLS